MLTGGAAPRRPLPGVASPGVADATVPATMPERIAAQLGRTRRRTLALTGCLDERELTAQHSRLMSPLVWDLAHIGCQEELWLLRHVGGAEPIHPEIDDLYDAFQHPRRVRPKLPLLSPAEARGYVATVRGRVLDLLERTPLAGTPLLEGGFAFGMIAQHEQQHNETMLATHQLRRGAAVLDAPPPPPPEAPTFPDEVLIPAGVFTMGTTTEDWALDNERPAHEVALPAYWIDTVPVTNVAYQAFIEAGGYDDERLWSPTGWEYRQRVGLGAPLFWRREAGVWLRRRFGRLEPVPADEPVQHVCWYEAQAFARWVGRRLPTEAEWEKAARHDLDTGRSRRFPWGEEGVDERRANLGQRHLQPAPVGSFPDGASAYGVRQLIGDVWEWTDTDFTGYPGFRAWPYREYSEVFFGLEHKVLRGGSFATDPVAVRATFRNWDYPIRRQIFCGFRTARDAL